MRPIRVCFTGASGVGKTTLARWVSEEFGVPFCPVTGRSVALDMGYPSPYAAKLAGEHVQFYRRLVSVKHAWEAANRERGFAAERGYLDELAYMGLHSPESVELGWFDEAYRWQRDYTHQFYLPRAWHQDLTDPMRKTDPGYHEFYEAMLEGLMGKLAGQLSTAHVRTTTLPYGDLEVRKGVVAHKLREYRASTEPRH